MRGGEIVLNARVNRVVVEDNAVIGISVNNEFHSFSGVISTAPVQFLPDIVPELPEQIRNDLRSIENIAVVCVVAKLRNPVTPYFWINTNDPSMDMPGFIEYSNLRELESTVVYVPFYLPQTHPTYLEEDSAFEIKVRTYLMSINPTLIDEDFLAIMVNRYRYAQPICQPGHLSKLPPIDLPIEGLWAADTSYYYPEDRGISESIAMGQQIARSVVASNQL
jgi:protoporphyrinogen oxidase